MSLHDMLAQARESATGAAAEEIAPGVMRAEAEIAAWHACVVQGGFSTPEIEAERLSKDRGLWPQIHMASTVQIETFGDWFALCRCLWSSPHVDTQEEARALGDAHLAKANA